MPGALGPRAAAFSILAVLALLSIHAPTAHAEVYQYSGCVEGVVAAAGLGPVPVRACLLLTLGEERPRVSITSVAAPAPLSSAQLRGLVSGALEAAISAAAELEAAASPSEGRVVYVRGGGPVACEDVYEASDGGVRVVYIPAGGDLIPALIEGSVDDYTITLSLAYTDAEDACGRPLLTPGKRMLLEAGTAALTLGAIAASLWRMRSLRFEV